MCNNVCCGYRVILLCVAEIMNLTVSRCPDVWCLWANACIIGNRSAITLIFGILPWFSIGEYLIPPKSQILGLISLNQGQTLYPVSLIISKQWCNDRIIQCLIEWAEIWDIITSSTVSNADWQSRSRRLITIVICIFLQNLIWMLLLCNKEID